MVNEEIDVLLLYSQTDAKAWNLWLTRCLQNGNLSELVKTRRGIQIGMSSAQKKGLVNEKLAETYARWIGSIDKTIRKVVKNRDQLTNDIINNKGDAKSLKEKRQRDSELEKFLRKESY